MVEPFSVDESWLDVTASLNLFGNGRRIADTIRKTVKDESWSHSVRRRVL